MTYAWGPLLVAERTQDVAYDELVVPGARLEANRTADRPLPRTILAGLPGDLLAEGTILDGRPAHQLTRRSKRLDLLLLGSRGYNPLHALLADGVSGRVLRDAHCPVIAVPRRAEAPLEFLAGARRYARRSVISS